MRWLVIGAIMLSGCGEKASVRLEREYDKLIALNAPLLDRCGTARALAEALYEEGDRGKSMLWRVRADHACDAAKAELGID